MKKVVALFAVAGFAAVAAAQPGNRTGVDVMVRLAGDTEWSAAVDALPGDVVEVASFYFRSVGHGFGGAIHNIRATGWTPGDMAAIQDNPESALHPDGRQSVQGANPGGFNFGGQRQDIYLAGVNAPMRISAFGNPNDIAAGGISVRQNTPVALGADFNTSDGVMGYRFNITVGDGFDRVIDIAAGNFATFSTYANAGSTSATPYTGPREDHAASIRVVPTPASLALLGLGGLAAGRRRR